MKNQSRKCSIKKHSEIDAINFCQECKIYLCNKCKNYHSELFENHHLYDINKNIKNIFTGFCEEENHNKFELKYFCKTHNKLCCMACICKFKEEGNGQHKDCDTCIIKNIKEEKKNNLNKNIIILEELFNKLEESIKKIKIIYEKINENKEELKLKIQKIFTQIRNALNEREDKLLIEVDNIYNDQYFNEDIIKQSEKLPNTVKISLEKGKKINNEWNDDKLNSLIYDCINIENNIKEINTINEKLEKCHSNSNIKI